MCLTNSVIPITFTLIIFSIWAPSCLGWPLDASLDLSFILDRVRYFSQIDLTSQVNALKCSGRGPEHIRPVHNPPASSRAWRDEEAYLHQQLTRHDFRRVARTQFPKRLLKRRLTIINMVRTRGTSSMVGRPTISTSPFQK